MELAAHKGEASAKLKEKFLDVINKPLLKIALLGVFREGEEVEDIRVFEGLLGEVGLG